MKTKTLTRGAKKIPLSFLTLSLLAAAAYSNGTTESGADVTPVQSLFDLAFEKLDTELVPEPGASLLVWEQRSSVFCGCDHQGITEPI